MNYTSLIASGISAFLVGSVLGYYTRQLIAKKDWKTIEAKLQKRIDKATKKANSVLSEAKEKASLILKKAEKREASERKKTLKINQSLLKKAEDLNERSSQLEKKQENYRDKVEELRKVKKRIEELNEETIKKLEEVSGLNEKEARKRILKKTEEKYKLDILKRIKKLEEDGFDRFEERAKEILSTVIQKCALDQSKEITTSSIDLSNEDVKGKIIGKKGRNIRAFERETGVELIVDETPESVIVSSFDPVRRHIAKHALERLIADGRIQPARIEKKVEEATEEINKQIKKAGETATYRLNLVGLHPKLVQLIGRLKFRTSYGQNVLLHSIEVAYLASALAEEIGANASICKKAGLLHDIGKAVDHEIEGSHVDIGIRILERFGIEEEVIQAMKSHHEEYPYESIEAVLIQTADQISGARPGARKDTLERYLKRLAELEDVATSFQGVEKAWALQAGREIRVFVKPDQIDDLKAKKLARKISERIQQQLQYPGEIKVTVIRETRVIEYAK